MDFETVATRVSERWEALKELHPSWEFEIPSRTFGVHQGLHYLTISDSGPVHTFASRRGDIYVAVRSKCQPAEMEGQPIHLIAPGALQIVSCPTPKTKTPFQLEVIKEVLIKSGFKLKPS